ncbi:MAG: hypothetical protein RLZZ399_2226, partial [Verrucomicrobiota bacterium]
MKGVKGPGGCWSFLRSEAKHRKMSHVRFMRAALREARKGVGLT